MTGFVLDASALLALLLAEPGADEVKARLDGSVMTTVNLAEVVSHYAKLGLRALISKRCCVPCRSDGPPSMPCCRTRPACCVRSRLRVWSVAWRPLLPGSGQA